MEKAAAIKPDASGPLTMRQRILSIFGGSVGNLIDWYDWYVYTAFALYFAKAFFPSGDQTTELLKAAAVFAIGFLARPVGGWLLGAYADRHGRKKAVILSVYMMCAGSFLISFCPSYGTIGIMAPIILLLARILQGISCGAVYGTAATYLSEMADKEHRGFYASFQYVTLIMGQLLATLLLVILQQLFLTPAQLQEWGWRIPFFLGGLIAVVVVVIQRKMQETPSFGKSASKDTKKNLLVALMQHPKAVLTVVGLTLGGTIAFYTYSSYMQRFLANTTGYTKEMATLISAATLFVFMLLQPVFGALSDKVGRKPLLIAFGILGSIFTVPILNAVSTAGNVWYATGLIMLGLLIVSGYTSVNAIVKAELFPVEIRALGVGLPYALTVSIFGGTAETLALWLKKIGHEHWFYWYVAGCIFISLLVYGAMRDTKKTSLIEE